MRVANLKGHMDPQMVVANSRQEVDKLGTLEREPEVIYAGPTRVRPGGLSVGSD